MDTLVWQCIIYRIDECIRMYIYTYTSMNVLVYMCEQFCLLVICSVSRCRPAKKNDWRGMKKKMVQNKKPHPLAMLVKYQTQPAISPVLPPCLSLYKIILPSVKVTVQFVVQGYGKPHLVQARDVGECALHVLVEPR